MPGSLIKKICPLISLAALSLSCGKKITEAKAGPSKQIENQILPASFNLELDGSNGLSHQQEIPRSARFYFPSSLIVEEGNPLNHKVEVSYDVDEFDADDFLLKRFYKPSHDLKSMVLEKCVNYDNTDLGIGTYEAQTILKDEIIQLKYVGVQKTDLVVSLNLTMKWY